MASKIDVYFQYDEFDYTRLPVLTKAVFFMFAVFVPILLLNMLIAMMGNTYQLVISRSAKEWKRQVHGYNLMFTLNRTGTKNYIDASEIVY